MDGIFENRDKEKRRNNDYYDEFRDELQIEARDKLKDKVTSLKNFLDIFQKRMEGWEHITANNKLTYTGRVLAGSQTIQKLVALISPFAENTNLIGEVKPEEYYRKKYRIHSTVNSILLTSSDVYPENYNTIMETFKSTFVNIGNVILSSKGLLEGQFKSEDRDFSIPGEA